MPRQRIATKMPTGEAALDAPAEGRLAFSGEVDLRVMEQTRAALAQEGDLPEHVSLHAALERLRELEEKRRVVEEWSRGAVETLSTMIAAVRTLLATHWPGEVDTLVKIQETAGRIAVLAGDAGLPVPHEEMLRILVDAWRVEYEKGSHRVVKIPRKAGDDE